MITESYLFCYYCQNSVRVLRSTHTHIHTHTYTHTHTHTHTHTLPSEVLKPSKIWTLRFCNTTQYSLDIPTPECLLLGFARDTNSLQFTSVQEVKESVPACLAIQPKIFFYGVYSSLSAVGLTILKNRGAVWKKVLSHIFCCW